MSHAAHDLSRPLCQHTYNDIMTQREDGGAQCQRRANISQFSEKKGEGRTNIEEQRLYYPSVFTVRNTLIAVQGSASRVAGSQGPLYNEDALSDNQIHLTQAFSGNFDSSQNKMSVPANMKAGKKKISRCHIASLLMVAMFYLFIHILMLLDEAGFILCELVRQLPKFAISFSSHAAKTPLAAWHRIPSDSESKSGMTGPKQACASLSCRCNQSHVVAQVCVGVCVFLKYVSAQKLDVWRFRMGWTLSHFMHIVTCVEREMND